MDAAGAATSNANQELTMFTFKAQAKSNAKRFLVKTSKIDEALLDQYLTQRDGEWGCYIDDKGQPVPAETGRVMLGGEPVRMDEPVAGQPLTAEEAPAAVVAPVVADEPAEPMPSGAGAFGAFAMAQLTAPSNTAAPADAPRAAREGATPTAGLKIQKDRPEQNGMRRQSAGSVGDRLWALYDKAGPEVTLEQAKALAAGAGLSTTSAAIALYNWRRFNGIATTRATK
jgi:hypothetical protein